MPIIIIIIIIIIITTLYFLYLFMCWLAVSNNKYTQTNKQTTEIQTITEKQIKGQCIQLHNELNKKRHFIIMNTFMALIIYLAQKELEQLTQSVSKERQLFSEQISISAGSCNC
jgi:flagellar basal body-associated protein FliL